MGCSKSSSKREVYRKQKKSQINNLSLHLKDQTKPLSIREEIIKFRAEINEIETKNQ